MKSNYIHPTAIIEPQVKLGYGNYVGPFCYIAGDTIIGNNNKFEAYCSIGTSAEHRDFYYEKGKSVIIGDNNLFKEFITIHNGTVRNTQIGNNVQVFNHSHIAHDNIIEDNVNISANVTIAGHVYIMEGSILGIGSVFHQFSVIGSYSIVGMNSTVTLKYKILPFSVYIGTPAIRIKDNLIGIERNNITKSIIDQQLKDFAAQKNNMLINFFKNYRYLYLIILYNF
jgi:UDP-N-acetylglucosamine acyltransferase